jgi:hypothetical protein
VTNRGLRSPKAALAIDGYPLLEFYRTPLERYVRRGFALAWNEDLTLIEIVDGDLFELDGYAVFRNSDIKQWRAKEVSA